MKTALAFLVWAVFGFIIARSLALPAVYCDAVESAGRHRQSERLLSVWA